MRSGDPWIKATSQRWKLAVFWALLSLAAVQIILLIVGVRRGTLHGDDDLVLGLGATFAMVIGFVWIALSVRCPVCDGRVAWVVLKKSSVDEWWIQLVHATVCPICKSAPKTSKV